MYPLYLCLQFSWKENNVCWKKFEILNKNRREVYQPQHFVSRKNLPEKTACSSKTRKPFVLVSFGKNTPTNFPYTNFFLTSATYICNSYRQLYTRLTKCYVLVYEFMNTVLYNMIHTSQLWKNKNDENLSIEFMII